MASSVRGVDPKPWWLLCAACLVYCVGFSSAIILSSYDDFALDEQLLTSLAWEQRERNKIVDKTELLDQAMDAVALVTAVGTAPVLLKRGALRVLDKIAEKFGKPRPRTLAVNLAFNLAPRSVQRSITSTYRTYVVGSAGYRSNAAKLMYRIRVDQLSRRTAKIRKQTVDPRNNMGRDRYELAGC